MLSNKKLTPTVTELFIRARKLNTPLVFITQSYFTVPKDIRLNLTHILLWKIQTKENLNKLHLIIHQISTFKTSWIFIKSVLKNHIVLIIDTILAAGNPSRFRENLLERI